MACVSLGGVGVGDYPSFRLRASEGKYGGGNSPPLSLETLQGISDGEAGHRSYAE